MNQRTKLFPTERAPVEQRQYRPPPPFGALPLSVTLPCFLNPTWTDSFSLASLSCFCASGEIVASAWVKSRVCSVPARGCVSGPDDEPSLAVRGSCCSSRIARASTRWQVQRL